MVSIYQNKPKLTQKLQQLQNRRKEMRWMVVKPLNKRDEDILVKNYWNPEEIGETLEGTIKGIYDSIFQDDEGNKKNLGKVMLIEDANGDKWETKPHVDLREYIPQLQEGDYVVIELVNMEEPRNPGGYPKKIYSVGIEDGE